MDTRNKSGHDGVGGVSRLLPLVTPGQHLPSLPGSPFVTPGLVPGVHSIV